ncbi:MAG TPA: OmpH family outer membrane protein [Halanaerobiales bacterium]|nr:OmpH family outer membrane protein [Halanaerobiales bacterium]
MYKNIAIVLALIIIALVAYYAFYSIEKKIGVIDMEKLLNESKRAAELQSNLENKGKELEEKYENLEGEDVNLEEKKDQISMEYAQAKQEIEKQLNNEIDKVISELNKNNEYQVILYKNKVYYGGEDITDRVIKLLDEKHSEVDENESE